MEIGSADWYFSPEVQAEVQAESESTEGKATDTDGRTPRLDELAKKFNGGLLLKSEFRERIVNLWLTGAITPDEFCEYDRMQANAYLPQSHFADHY